MSINQYILPTSNLIQIDLTNVVATGNTDLVTTQNNAYGVGYLTNSIQACTIFSVYICVSAAVSLVVKRYVTSTATILPAEVFPAEIANQPNWHSFPVSQFEQIQIQVSGNCQITKLVVMEPKNI
jgi:hypothetical protein